MATIRQPFRRKPVPILGSRATKIVRNSPAAVVVPCGQDDEIANAEVVANA
jgi:hypothetical protein